MNKPLCNTECELEDLEIKNICCYYCSCYITCANPCKGKDCEILLKFKYKK